MDYSSMAEFKTSMNKTAAKMGLNYIDMWIPYKRQDDTSLTYVSIYSGNKTINKDMWGPNLHSPGDQCVHCYYHMCTDDNCGLKKNSHICMFPSGAPVMQLQGLCSDTLLGKTY